VWGQRSALKSGLAWRGVGERADGLVENRGFLTSGTGACAVSH
jgi:hypothetical protein